MTEKMTSEETGKIKFIVNGKVFHYTREELLNYLKDLFKNNGEYFDEDDLDRVIAKLKKYDGDIYGNIPEETRKGLHELLEDGAMMVLY